MVSRSITRSASASSAAAPGVRATASVAHAGRHPRGDAGRRVLDHRRSRRGATPSRSAAARNMSGAGLPLRDLVARDRHGERVGQAGAAQRPVEPRARRRGRHRDAARPASCSSRDRLERVVERLELVVDQREQRRRSTRPRTRRLAGSPGIALGEERVAALVREAEQPAVVRLPHGVAVARQPLVPGAAGERLGVDERAVAVEDDGGGVDARALDHDGGELDQTRRGCPGGRGYTARALAPMAELVDAPG